MKTIVFDFGNVVGFFDHRKAIHRLAPFAKLTPEEMFSAVYLGQFEDDFERNIILADAFLAGYVERCGLTCDVGQLREAFVDIFTPNPEVCELIPKLKGRYRILLGSNTNVLHATQFRAQFADVLGHFDHLVMSYEIGVRKPERAFFEHCQRHTNAAPDECLFLDDIEENVASARSIGWKAIVYKPSNGLHGALRAHGVHI